jgi:hypothetical protein
MAWTKKKIIDKVLLDLDLQEETGITPSEMEGYLHEAIGDCEAIIHNIDEDYFVRSRALPIVAGVRRVSLPADIYASKIRGMIYNDGSKRYAIKRIRPYQEFETLTELDINPSSEDELRYLLVNDDAATDVQIEFHPAPAITSSTVVTLWYLRDASRPTADGDLCDIPEFINYIFAHMKRSCMAKEGLGVAPPEAHAAVSKQESRMTATLENRTPDNDSELQLDLGHYMEHS